MTIAISARGQMVIPAFIRKKYGLKSKSRMEILDLGKEVVLVPIPPKVSLMRAQGVMKGVSTADLIKERRSLREKEHFLI